jgi:tRNA pseudouridine55 synthase
VRPTKSQIEDVLPRFRGTIEQVPPAYSALMIDGRRAYDRARAGENVDVKSRLVTVHAMSLRSTKVAGPPGEDVEEATLSATVSKGTYIRSLARDIAHALGTVGSVATLRRTRAGPFGAEQAISLDKLAQLGKAHALEQALLPLTAGLDDIPALTVTPDQAKALREGRKLSGIAARQGLHLATVSSVPVALVEFEGAELRVVRGFNL